MTYSEAIDYIHSLRSVGMQLGLERMEAACAALNHPERAYPAVHIAGTNGKGSTTAMLSAMLTANGYRVGTFTSPYFFDPRETIAVHGEMISKERFSACAERVRTACSTGLSEYEFLTAIMFCCFEEEQIDIAVIECCLGGKEDATNVIPPPLCAVFTPIALDHTAVLGDTITQITQQKSGIAKAPADIVCAPQQSEEVLAVLFEKAAADSRTVYTVQSPREIACFASGTVFSHGDLTVNLALIGRHQADNAATALTVIDRLRACGLQLDTAKAIAALRTVSMPCRLELIEDEGPVLLDGAHNPHGIAALCQTIKAVFDEPITLVLGMLADKDIARCLSLITPLCRTIICCTPQNTARALPAFALAQLVSSYAVDVMYADDPWEAYQNAKKAAARSPIVVGGSFYTASYVRKRLICKA